MRTFKISLLVISTWLLWLVVSQYLLCARFDFEDPAPFEGSQLYNPYASVNTKSWVKCNFHAHARAWNGITNGHGTASDIHEQYQKLDYKVHCVSNYHDIDTTRSREKNYIPAYEHGYNLRKTHQLVLGSSDVKWLDYLLPQTLHNKQHVLQQLHDTNAVIILNHPGLRNGYVTDDFYSLSGYHCMEVLNPSVISTKEWDAALSSGKQTFIVGNDDIHDVLAKERLGRMCTFVNVENETRENVLKALKTGKSYGVDMAENQAVDSIPFLADMQVTNDTISIKMSAICEEITLTGQDGKLLGSYKNTDALQYRIAKQDHYARATCRYKNGTTLYLNPVFFTPQAGYRENSIYENVKETTFFRTLGVTILFLWLLIIWRMQSGKGGQSYSRRLSLE